MKASLLLTFLLILCLCLPLMVGEASPPDASALFQHALDATDIWSQGPFHLQGTLEIKGSSRKTVAGQYHLYWVDKNKWRDEIEIGGSHAIRLGEGNQVWSLPLHGLAAKIILDLQQLTNLQGYLLLRSGSPAGKVKSSKVKGSAVDCVTFKGRLETTQREACFDEASALPLGGSGVHYDNFAEFAGKQFPRKMRLVSNGWTAGLTVDKLEKASFPNSGTFTAPDSTHLRPGCFATLAPSVKTKVSPRYPEDAKSQRISGPAGVLMTVDAQGTPQNLEIIDSPSASLGKASTEAIKQWRYEPATCEGKPVEVQIIVEVNYALRG